ncbi:MAG: RNB domain-containing ribonuclease, partial [Dongiaceae bacterium]
IRPKHFTGLLQKAAGTPYAGMINTLVLRSQAQAVYAPENLGHFGLALQRYAHFTSPIRRYADLLVHRSLIKAYGFGEDGLAPGTEAEFSDIGDHISGTERRAAAAEREAIDRYTAAYLSARVGEIFAGRISSVTRFGLFISLNDSGADGLVPISSLPSDFYDHDERGHALVGRRWGRVYQLGAQVEVRLMVCTPLTGGITLEVVSGGEIAAPTDQAPADGIPARHPAAPKRPGGAGAASSGAKRGGMKSGGGKPGGSRAGRAKSRGKTAGPDGTASSDHPAAPKRKSPKKRRR